jgi:hypothetical protein
MAESAPCGTRKSLGLTALTAEFTVGEGELMTHDEPCSMAPDDKHDLISGTCSHLLKSVEITVDSPDGYIRASAQSNFDQCGELTGSSVKEVKTSPGPKNVFTTINEIQLNRTEFGWRIQLDANGNSR